jgi:hypothetical protein
VTTSAPPIRTHHDTLVIGGKWVAWSTDVEAVCAAVRTAFDQGPWPHMTLAPPCWPRQWCCSRSAPRISSASWP